MWFAIQRLLGLGFFLLVADVLAVGMLGSTGAATDEAARLFYVLLVSLLPLTFHFHHTLLDRPPRRLGWITLITLYALGAAVSVWFILWTTDVLEGRGWFVVLRTGIRLGLIFVFALAWLLLFREYRRRTSAVLRQRIRLITFGTLFAFAPFILLSLIPDTLGMPARVPYIYTLPWLLLCPLAYVYSLFRHRLVRTEVALNRATVYYLLLTLLLSLYLIAAAVLNYLLPNTTSEWPMLSALLSLVLLLLFAPFQRGLQRMVTWVFYGDEISYVRMVGQVAESLATTLDRETLRHLLIDELSSAMRLSKSVLFLRDEYNTLVLLGAAGLTSQSPGIERISVNGPLVRYLEAAAKPLADTHLRRGANGESLSLEERALLSVEGVAFWLPLVSGRMLQGLLLIGYKMEGEYFTADDERIMATLVHQSAIAAHNLRLMEQVRAGHQELALAHQELLVVHEREQRRLAHELHDGALQQLLGVSILLANNEQRATNGQGSGEPNVAGLTAHYQNPRREVLSVVAKLRELIGELLPAGLGELSLDAVLDGYVTHLTRKGTRGMPKIELDLDKGKVELPEPVATCLFRVAQEALRNALKHAQARHIWLGLHLRDDQVALSIRDDGCGFRVPARLSELANGGHFGLVSVAERVAWADGQLALQSKPGGGTEVLVHISLSEAKRDGGQNDSCVAGG